MRTPRYTTQVHELPGRRLEALVEAERRYRSASARMQPAQPFSLAWRDSFSRQSRDRAPATMPASSDRRGCAMKKFATLAAAALMGVGALGSTAAEARGGGAIAAGVIGGLAAGALLGAAVSEAHAAPAYGYGYARPAPVYDTKMRLR